MAEDSAFSLKRFLVGKPIPSHLAHHERLSRVTGLAVLSSDALSSVAYATEAALVVEIESRSSRRDDRQLKPGLYAEAGIPAYWRVERHPEGPHLHAYELVDGAYREVSWVRPGVTWRTTSPFPVLLDPGAWSG